MNFSAVILAGGKSSRMGRDKARLTIGGQILLARQIDLARSAGAAEVFISGRTGTDYSALGCQVLPDHFPDAGPLAGIERALNATGSPLLLVLAVDMPAMSIEFLNQLYQDCTAGSGVVPLLAGHIEPLVAFYPKAALRIAVELLEQKRGGLKPGTPGPADFARRCARENLIKLIAVSATATRYFTNLNTPEDLNRQNSSML